MVVEFVDAKPSLQLQREWRRRDDGLSAGKLDKIDDILFPISNQQCVRMFQHSLTKV